MKILVLGGTSEARTIATALAGMGHEVITSLAGRTQNPLLPDGGTVRTGGFGGAAGLGTYLLEEGIERLVDATHPYAAQMAENAARAAEITGVPIVRMTRPGWIEPQYAFWHRMADFTAAAAMLPKGARALLTIGHKGLDPFFARDDCTFLIRAIEMPEWLPPHCWAIQSRPPYYVSAETELMRREKISHLVSKNSGGAQTEAKLYAAQGLGLTTIIVERPTKPKVPEYQSVGRCIAALRLDRE